MNKLSQIVIRIYLCSWVVLSCSSPVKEDNYQQLVIENSMHGITENVAYSKVGKLKLSDYGLFKQPLRELKPAEKMMLYDLNTPLFTDYANKKRYIFIPDKSTIQYRATESLEFPEGTILVKNFFYSDNMLETGSAKIIETRLLIRKNDNWIALPYIWNEEQTVA